MKVSRNHFLSKNKTFNVPKISRMENQSYIVFEIQLSHGDSFGKITTCVALVNFCIRLTL